MGSERRRSHLDSSMWEGNDEMRSADVEKQYPSNSMSNLEAMTREVLDCLELLLILLALKSCSEKIFYFVGAS